MRCGLTRVAKLQRAAKIIETDGVSGIDSATWVVGLDVAMGMLIMHIRRNLGSADIPPRPDIDEVVLEELKRLGVV